MFWGHFEPPDLRKEREEGGGGEGGRGGRGRREGGGRGGEGEREGEKDDGICQRVIGELGDKKLVNHDPNHQQKKEKIIIK